MKINGQNIHKPNIEIIVIPRGDGNDIVFKAQAILDYSEFEAICPQPTPGVKMLPGGKKVVDFEHPKFKEDQAKFGSYKIAWTVLKSLQATEGLEWETVDMSNPETWPGWSDELKAAGFSEIEAGRIFNGVLAANCLDEAKIEEARKRFFTGAAEAVSG